MMWFSRIKKNGKEMTLLLLLFVIIIISTMESELDLFFLEKIWFTFQCIVIIKLDIRDIR